MVDRLLEARRLEYFLAVIDHGGMSRGACALHVARGGSDDRATMARSSKHVGSARAPSAQNTS
jgi:hypothetical protein